MEDRKDPLGILSNTESKSDPLGILGEEVVKKKEPTTQDSTTPLSPSVLGLREPGSEVETDLSGSEMLKPNVPAGERSEKPLSFTNLTEKKRQQLESISAKNKAGIVNPDLQDIRPSEDGLTLDDYTDRTKVLRGLLAESKDLQSQWENGVKSAKDRYDFYNNQYQQQPTFQNKRELEQSIQDLKNTERDYNKRAFITNVYERRLLQTSDSIKKLANENVPKGFFEGVYTGLKGNIDSWDSSIELAKLSKQEQINYAKKQAEIAPTKEVGRLAEFGEMVGGVVPDIATAIGFSLVGLPYVGAATVAARQGAQQAAEDFSRAFNEAKQGLRTGQFDARGKEILRYPSDDEAYEIATKAAGVGFGTGALEGIVGTTTGGLSTKIASRASTPLKKMLTEKLVDTGADALIAGTMQTGRNVYDRVQGLDTKITEGVAKNMIGEVLLGVPINAVTGYREYKGEVKNNAKKAIYEAVEKSKLEPEELIKLKQNIEVLKNQGAITNNDYIEMNKRVDGYAKAIDSMPEDVQKRKDSQEIAELIVQRDDLTKQKEKTDEALKEGVDEKINAINSRIKEIVSAPPVEEVSPEVVLQKYTTPTDEKYGYIDSGDGKGKVELTKEEFINQKQQYATQEIKQQEGVSGEPESRIKGGKAEEAGLGDSVQRTAEGAEKEEVTKSVEQLLSKQYEKATKEEDGKPMPERVSGVRAEGEGGKESAELRTEEEEVTPQVGDISKKDENYRQSRAVTEAVSKENPEASILITPKGNDLNLTAVYVGKEKRGKGIGSKVLESVKRQADKLGKKVVLDATNELDEETDLERLGNFYEKNGFVKVGENKFEYNPKATLQAGGVVGGEIKSNWNYEGEGDAFASNKDNRDGKAAYTIRILDRNGRGSSYNRAKQRGELDTKSPLTYEGDKESISAIDGNGNTVGVIKLQTDGGVEHIVVAPEFSRKGVASELIKQIKQKGAKVNFEKSKLISPDAAKLFNKIRSEQSLQSTPQAGGVVGGESAKLSTEEVGRAKPSEGSMVTIMPQKQGFMQRKMIYEGGEWKEKIGNETTRVGNAIQQKAQEAFDEQNKPKEEAVKAKPVEEPTQVKPAEAKPTQAKPVEKAKPSKKEEPTGEKTAADSVADAILKGIGRKEKTGAEKAIESITNALKESGIKINVIENEEDYNKEAQKRGGGEGTEGMFVSTDGEIYLNKKALEGEFGETIVFHEGTHPVVNIIRNTNPALYNRMVKGAYELSAKNEGIASALKFANQYRMDVERDVDGNFNVIDEDGNIVATFDSEYKANKYVESMVSDEFVTEIIARIASGDIKIDDLPKTFVQSLIDLINKMLSVIGKEIKISDQSPYALKRNAEKIAEVLKEGRSISEVVGKENVKQYMNNLTSPEIISAGSINKKAISQAHKTKTPPISIYKSKEIVNLDVKSLEEIYDKYNGKAVVINSDPTRVGWLTLPSGKKIFMYGGPAYLSIKDNVDGNVGFATTQIKKVNTWAKYFKELFRNEKGVTFVATQAPTSIMSNSYALRYVMDAISTLPKEVLESEQFKKEFFGSDLVALKDAFGEKAYNEFISKYKNADLSKPKVIDNMISEMAYKIGDDNNPASFKARGAFVSNLLAGVHLKSKSKTIKGEVGYYSKNPKKYIAKQLYDRLGLNQKKLFYELGEKSLIDLYMNDGKWGFAVSGFETDPSVSVESIQQNGIKHPLFNAKFPSSNAFILDGAYEINKLFKPIEMSTPKRGRYTKTAAQMLAGSMYVKGERTEKKKSFEYSKVAPFGEKIQASKGQREEIESIIENSKADGTYLKAPNGNDTKLNEGQWATVRTKSFKNWFGDWENNPNESSQILDDNGEPKVMYTGTSKDKDFDKFNVPKNGVWFTESTETASNYAFENDSMNAKYNPNTGKYEDVNVASRVIPVFLNIRRPEFFNKAITKEQREKIKYVDNYKKLQGLYFQDIYYRKPVGQRTDGLYYSDNKDIVVVLESPNQIKSAIGNLGTFSPQNPKIQFSQGGRVDVKAKIAGTIKSLREQGISDKDIKEGIDKVKDQVGLSEADVNELMGVEVAKAATKPAPERESARQVIKDVIDNYYQTKEGKLTSSEKQKARMKMSDMMAKNPSIKYIFDKLTNIHKQLEMMPTGEFKKTKNCP